LSRNHVIGIRNDLPWYIPQDLNHFKTLTKGKPIIMGRLTYQSILDRRDGKPLPHRHHYVISRNDLGPLPDNVFACKDLQSAINKARADFPNDEVMIIGGASIYEQSVPLVDRMYLTIIDRDIEGDAFFPKFNPADWIESDRENFIGEEIPFSFITFSRK
jgi:dihydrofolate reductase